MLQNLETLGQMRPYFKRGILTIVLMIIMGASLLIYKAPNLIHDKIQTSLEHALSPLGIKHLRIQATHLKWGELHLENIQTERTPTLPELSIQSLKIVFSPLFKIRTLEIKEGQLNLKHKDMSKDFTKRWQSKWDDFTNLLHHIMHLKPPTINMYNCSLIIPTLQGPLKIPVRSATKTTLRAQDTFVIDWGDEKGKEFSGHLVFEFGTDITTALLKSTNIDFETESFHVKSPSLSLYSRFSKAQGNVYQVKGHAQIDTLKVLSFGSLKTPIELNLLTNSTSDYWRVKNLTLTSKDKKNTFNLQGLIDPEKTKTHLKFNLQIPQLSKIWNFKPLAEGKVSLNGSTHWQNGLWICDSCVLKIHRGSLIQKDFSIQNLSGNLHFETLFPFSTKKAQHIEIEKLTFHDILFENTFCDGFLDSQEHLQIHKITSHALGGYIKAYQFQRLTTQKTLPFHFFVNLEEIELMNILKLTNLDNLSGQAKLTGHGVMCYDSKQGFNIERAEIRAISKGLIQYKLNEETAEPFAFQQEEVNMAFQALNNLHFSTLVIQLTQDSQIPSEMQATVKMLGNNPNVLNGHPFEFNIVTTGKLKDLIINTLHHMTQPTNLKELQKRLKQSIKTPKTSTFQNSQSRNKND